MSALDLLKQVLGRVNSQLLRPEDATPFSDIETEVQKLEAWLGGAARGATPARDLIREAVLHFYTSHQLPNLRQARLVCFGCTEFFGPNRFRLIEDEVRFTTMLSLVDDYHGEPRAFRRCYRGLLFSYFVYDADEADVPPVGRRNWTMLRSYLHKRVAGIAAPGVMPDWVRAIQEHDALLTDDPCGRYGLAALTEDGAILEEFRSRLAISDASWVVRKLVMAQVDAATRQSHAGFVRWIPSVLKLLDAHKFLLAEGLAKVLARYSRITPRESHPELRDFSITAWGNPWLTLNDAKWGRVEPAVRDMVSGWLKLDFIRQFFNLLSEDRATDTRRLRFWERFVDHIDDMYFALGSDAASNISPDFKLLRQKMEGRRLTLNRSGSPSNNAFIMMLGQYAIVEFGITGNACFIFDRARLPFALSGQVAGDTSALKHRDRVSRLRHANTRHGKWEREFERELHHLLQGRTRAPATTHRAAQQPEPEEQRAAPETILRVNGELIERTFSRRTFWDFIDRHKLRHADNRAGHGALWVLTDKSNKVVTAQLTEWGFKYSESKPGWWKE